MQIKKEISDELQQNIDYLEQRFAKCADIIKKQFSIGKYRGHHVYLMYMDGLVNAVMIQDSIIRPLLNETLEEYPKSVEEWVIGCADR